MYHYSVFAPRGRCCLHNLKVALVVMTFVFITTAVAVEDDSEWSCKIEGGLQDSIATMNNNLPIPRVALGVYQTAPGRETYNAVKAALAAGYRHIDTGEWTYICTYI